MNIDGRHILETRDFKYTDCENGHFWMLNSIVPMVSGAVTNTLFIVPPGKVARTITSEQSTNYPDHLIEIYEDPVYTGGLDVTSLCKCMNRKYAGTPGITIIAGATIVNPGSLFYTYKIYGYTGVGGTYGGDFSPNPGGDQLQWVIPGPKIILSRVTNAGSKDGELSTAAYFYVY